jgi:hypothetical protein
MKKTAISLLFVFPVLCLSGCTTAQVYSSLQDAQRDRCERLAEPDRTQCLRSNSTDYETYKKQRERQ